MKKILEQHVVELSHEVQSLSLEREALAKRDHDIEIRLHQLVGAIYEIQRIIADLDHQPSAEQQVLLKVSEVEEDR